MFYRHSWSPILLPIIVVGAVELLSDTVLDPVLPFPADAVVVAFVAGLLSVLYWRFASKRLRSLEIELEQRSAELTRRTAAARALHRVSVATTAVGGLDDVLTAVVEQARLLLSVDVALLLVTGADGDGRLRASSGPPGVIDHDGHGPGPGPLRFVPADYCAVQLAAPLQRGGRTIGTLLVACRETRGFDVNDVETLSLFANQAAIALENGRLEARLRELAVVAERERIAREMHDGLAQVLGYVNTKSQAVETLLDAGRVQEARDQLGELAAASRSVYVDIREAILGLRSPIEPGTGLVGAIEAYAGRFADASKLAVSVKASAAARTTDFPPEVEAQVFRIVQEALTNVRKHAAAGRAMLRIATDEDGLEVTIDDDGRGFDDGDQPAGSWPHFGLVALRERAGSIGGSVTWQAVSGAPGTRVRLLVPLPAPPVRAQPIAPVGDPG